MFIQDIETKRNNAILSGLKVHHVALSRGYLRRESGFIVDYNGRFGSGFAVHYPTRSTKGLKTNNYHLVEYILK